MTMGSPAVLSPSSRKNHASIRRTNKPLVEKKRRARINDCLGQLKSLLLSAMKTEGTQVSRLEKADILEMTVKYLRHVQSQQPPTSALTPEPEVAAKFSAGYTECAAEVIRYMESVTGMTPDVKSRLETHLVGRLRGGSPILSQTKSSSSVSSSTSTTCLSNSMAENHQDSHVNANNGGHTPDISRHYQTALDLANMATRYIYTKQEMADDNSLNLQPHRPTSKQFANHENQMHDLTMLSCSQNTSHAEQKSHRELHNSKSDNMRQISGDLPNSNIQYIKSPAHYGKNLSSGESVENNYQEVLPRRVVQKPCLSYNNDINISAPTPLDTPPNTPPQQELDSDHSSHYNNNIENNGQRFNRGQDNCDKRSNASFCNQHENDDKLNSLYNREPHTSSDKLNTQPSVDNNNNDSFSNDNNFHNQSMAYHPILSNCPRPLSAYAVPLHIDIPDSPVAATTPSPPHLLPSKPEAAHTSIHQTSHRHDEEPLPTLLYGVHPDFSTALIQKSAQSDPKEFLTSQPATCNLDNNCLNNGTCRYGRHEPLPSVSPSQSAWVNQEQTKPQFTQGRCSRPFIDRSLSPCSLTPSPPALTREEWGPAVTTSPSQYPTTQKPHRTPDSWVAPNCQYSPMHEDMETTHVSNTNFQNTNIPSMKMFESYEHSMPQNSNISASGNRQRLHPITNDRDITPDTYRCSTEDRRVHREENNQVIYHNDKYQPENRLSFNEKCFDCEETEGACPAHRQSDCQRIQRNPYHNVNTSEENMEYPSKNIIHRQQITSSSYLSQHYHPYHKQSRHCGIPTSQSQILESRIIRRDNSITGLELGQNNGTRAVSSRQNRSALSPPTLRSVITGQGSGVNSHPLATCTEDTRLAESTAATIDGGPKGDYPSIKLGHVPLSHGNKRPVMHPRQIQMGWQMKKENESEDRLWRPW